jgi:hypothetical protein
VRRTILLSIILSEATAFAWPPGIPAPRERSIVFAPQQVVHYRAASANGRAAELAETDGVARSTGTGTLDLAVRDLTALDSDLRADEVPRFAVTYRAGGHELRLGNFRVDGRGSVFDPGWVGGGVITGDKVGRVQLAGDDSLPAGFADLAAFGLVDVTDESGRTIARDRACVVEIADGRAIVAVTGLGFDGDEQPVPGRPHGWLALSFPEVQLGDPTGDPARFVEKVGGGERPVGGLIELDVVDGAPDFARRAVLAVQRPDGGSLVIGKLSLDKVSFEAGVELHGHCDVTDAHGKSIADGVQISVFATKGGDVRVQIPGIFDVLARGATVR